MNAQAIPRQSWLPFTPLIRFSCALWGHVVDNGVQAGALLEPGGAAAARSIWARMIQNVRPAHALLFSCATIPMFVWHAHADQDACVRCGHPLVFPAGAATGLIASVSPRRSDMPVGCSVIASTPWRCETGSSIRVPLRSQLLETTGPCRQDWHPLLCFFTAHRVRFLTRRQGYTEDVCDDCGHPFCFADVP